MKTIILKVVSFLLAAAGFTSYVLALVNINSMDGALFSDIGNGCMITACFVSLWALHAARDTAGVLSPRWCVDGLLAA